MKFRLNIHASEYMSILLRESSDYRCRIGRSYAHNIDKKLEEIDRRSWTKVVENSFEANPEICPECLTFVIRDVVFSFQADKEIKKLFKTHGIMKGYFIPYRRSQPP